MSELVWLIPLLPLIGFIVNGLGRNTFSKGMIGAVGSAVVLISFVCSCLLFSEVYQARQAGQAGIIEQHVFDWIAVGNLKIGLSFLVDPLSAIMLLIVTGIGFLIHVYSIGYMHHDHGFGKFFAYLNLFIFFMLLLVLGSNYLVMFIGWEGVGLCSYLLIGFWYKNSSYANAAKKAFVMNRIGDLGFLLAVFLILGTFGSLEFSTVFPAAKNFAVGDITVVSITILLFIAATGKSAQIPLFTWLPDAMAGPTPVSALIHAATMVTAGIYMIARSNVLFILSPFTLQLISVIAICTALLAAAIALTQNDIKKVLAYSTVSQLGYMFLGLGVGAFTGAFFHVLTHAFFKALLFLGAGSVIHGMSEEQDMRKMGGLKKAMPITYLTMLMGTIAIAGIPPFSGFFSKDEILAGAFAASPVLWGLGFIGALMTAFYMFRMLFMTFFGTFRGTEEQKHHLHESPKSMTMPLIVLAILSVVGGVINLPAVLGGNHWLEDFLAPVFSDGKAIIPATHHLEHSTEYLLMAVSVVGVLIMVALAFNKYVKRQQLPEAAEGTRSFLANLSYNKFYVDELYDSIIVRPINWLSAFFGNVVDQRGIDGVVNGAGKATFDTGKVLRLLQNGNVGFYLLMMVIGVIAIFIYGLLSL
ncbi:NADH-quinone oxidoreductase subunit L [Sphingobacterium multivorum]|uniref:NADH-quinone oxidoreductase subunit L n=1 Tax=Sphingobacterium multivorum TaxID=28454 RepID=A0A2X2J1C9_SPHMU|nr:NADH-quinone oxidoreductase subunit L [Sphingobacterium multivorum]QRQ60880.1 NADH-quinone oxidoreductase subunit L [Sphingobacterium multivorum]SPZ87818.1 NADH-quinone oxidoreductase subunit L [Sphingobacterium multivorum]